MSVDHRTIIYYVQTLAVPVNVTAYKISFLSPSGAILSSKSIYPALDLNCTVNVRFLCPPLSSESVKINFTVHVSAVNSFGQGPSSSINKSIGNIYHHAGASACA